MRTTGCTLLLCALALAIAGVLSTPVAKRDVVGLCAFMCDPENPCPVGKKCVGTECGGSFCEETPRQEESMVGICAFTCDDEEKPCPEGQQCRRTGCGGTACQ